MAEDFQGAVCGGNWWNSPRNLFGSSPCSSEIGSFGWPCTPHELIMELKSNTRSSDESSGSVSGCDKSQVMGNNLSSAPITDNWNQDLINNCRASDEDYSQIILQEPTGLNPSMNYRQENWNSKNFCKEDSSISAFKLPYDSITSSTGFSQGLSNTFPLDSSSYNSYTASLLQTLFDTDEQETNYSPNTNYRMNSNEFLPTLNKPSPMVEPNFIKRGNYLELTNKTPVWNATDGASRNVGPNFLPSTQSDFLPSNNAKNNVPNFGEKRHNEEDRIISTVAKKVSNEPAFKRPRIETPSPLPTFKVRKEKLGDRITALQQLVSPFGKTDTASVLQEAIEYIKFLHDQVSVLSTPYLKNGSPPHQRHQVGDKLIKDQEGLKQDLKSRGLCLVPISSTFPVAAETTTDFWTPTFGGNFR